MAMTRRQQWSVHRLLLLGMACCALWFSSLSRPNNLQLKNERSPTAARSLHTNGTSSVDTASALPNKEKQQEQDNHATTISPPQLLQPNDAIYQPIGWDHSPIVVPRYKLVFFAIPKNGCTQFKMLFRRIMGYNDWNVVKSPRLPHDPRYNGLHYLYQYKVPAANEIMTSPDWTRAVFVRDPKERFLSAYLDKAIRKDGAYVSNHCCRFEQTCALQAQTMEGFLNVTRVCHDAHWRPQSECMDAKFWSKIDIVGNLANAQTDTRRLLERIGASWDEYGKDGWGRHGNESLFESTASVKHATGSSGRMNEYFTRELERLVEERYHMDYAHFKLKLPMTKLKGLTRSSSDASAQPIR